jgi:hypothetical protein
VVFDLRASTLVTAPPMILTPAPLLSPACSAERTGLTFEKRANLLRTAPSIRRLSPSACTCVISTAAFSACPASRATRALSAAAYARRRRPAHRSGPPRDAHLLHGVVHLRLPPALRLVAPELRHDAVGPRLRPARRLCCRRCSRRRRRRRRCQRLLGLHPARARVSTAALQRAHQPPRAGGARAPREIRRGGGRRARRRSPSSRCG